MINPILLAQALADPTIAAMSDADAATALSAPIYTPRTDPITVTTLASAEVWGFTKTTATMAAFKASSDPSAATLLAILSGPGFSATDPQISALGPSFVALSGGVINDQDVINAVNTTSYRCGDVVQTSDVTAARAAIALAAGYQTATTLASGQYNATVTWLQSQQQAGTAAPDTATVLAYLGTQH